MKSESVLIDKKQVFLLFFSSVVIMILVFGAGVFFGKKLSGVAVSNADKTANVIKKDNVETKSNFEILDAGLSLDIAVQTDKGDDNSTKRKEVETQKVIEQKPQPQKVPEENKVVSDVKETKEKREERKVDKQKVAQKSESVIESKKQEIIDAKFTIQVGAFPDRSQALKIAAELENKGYESWIQRAKSKDKDIFRVRIGRFATKSDAEKFKQQFDKKEKYNSFITPLE